MKKIADVSIIAANYNNAAYLDAFIGSVVNSTMLPKELIIVDDGSTDHSSEILRSYRDLPFLKIFVFPLNKGFTTALNTALDAARGKYIMRADPDDILLPVRIEKQTQYLDSHPETDVLGSNASYFNGSSGQIINTSNFPVGHEPIVATYRKGEHGVLHATVCAKREVYQKYRYQSLSPGEDYEIFARMARDGYVFENLSEPLYKVRVHQSSSTSTLAIEGIQRTFQFRDQIFGTKTSSLKIWMYYQHIRFYRRYQLSDQPVEKQINLLIAVVFYPSKLLRRIKGVRI